MHIGTFGILIKQLFLFYLLCNIRVDCLRVEFLCPPDVTHILFHTLLKFILLDFLARRVKKA